MSSLQELRILTYEKIPSLYKLNKRKVNEMKVKEVPARSAEAASPAPVDPISILPVIEKPKPNTEANRIAWSAYRDAYVQRYDVEPVRNATVNTQISNFVKRVGEEAPAIIAFYLTHNDAFYLKSMHQFGLALRDAEALRTQWLKNRAVTMKDVRDFENSSHYHQQLEKIKKGEI